MKDEGQQLRLSKLAKGGTNWFTYKDRIVWTLQGSTISEHLKLDTPSAKYTALGTQNSLTPAAQWKKEEGDIMAVFAQTLPDTTFNKIKGSANIKATWDGLKALYRDCSKALIANIIWQFQNKCYGEDESICAHFESFADLREQLASMGKEVDDENYTDTLMTSLPCSYNSAIQSITARVKVSKGTITADIFEELIINKSERCKIRDKTKGAKAKDEALTASTANSSRKIDKDKDKCNIECEEPTGGPLLMWGEQGLKATKGAVVCKVGDEDKEPQGEGRG